jgi:hypothetical protein
VTEALEAEKNHLPDILSRKIGEESVTAEDDGAEDDGDGDDSDLEKLTSEELMERIFVIEERLTELRC